MRVQRRDFWVPAGPTAPLQPREGLETITLLPTVAQLLRRQLQSPARVRGGLLFGFYEQHTLQVILASTAGSPSWYTTSTRDVLAVDDRFTLGWSEALFALWAGRVDWVGNWAAHRDGQLRSEARDHRRFRRGQKLGLFDDQSVLLIPGWADGAFSTRAYAQDPGGQPEEVPCHEGPGSLVDAIGLLTSQGPRSTT